MFRIAERLLLMRRFEEKLMELSEAKLLTGIFHVYVGQEAVGAGVMEALRPEDRILTNHRNHGHLIGRGVDPGRAMAEILGRSTGLCRGKAGSFHLCDAEHGFLQTSAVLGGSISLALGAAYGLKRSGAKGVVVVFFGDASLEEGVAGEVLNVAALHRLPLLFVLENNNLGARRLSEGGTAANTVVRSFLDIPRLYGIEAVELRDPGVEAVADATRAAIARAESGGGPTFLDMVLYRWPGLNSPFPQAVTGPFDIRTVWDPARIAGKHANWIVGHDPVLRFFREVIAGEPAHREAIASLDADVRARIDSAATFALDSPYPDKESAYADVFA
jgi:pyruvate dehydrogenase E1 component alpha subunit